jgi:hypothetical protein
MVIIKIHEVYVESQGFCLFAPPIFFISEMLRERPLGYGFFLKKYSDSQCCWKKYSDFGGGEKN